VPPARERLAPGEGGDAFLDVLHAEEDAQVHQQVVDGRLVGFVQAERGSTYLPRSRLTPCSSTLGLTRLAGWPFHGPDGIREVGEILAADTLQLALNRWDFEVLYVLANEECFARLPRRLEVKDDRGQDDGIWELKVKGCAIGSSALQHGHFQLKQLTRLP
jgi:hypothetical protein